MPNSQFDMSLPKEAPKEPVETRVPEEKVTVKKNSCVLSVPKADLPKWEKQGFKIVE